MMLNFRTNCTFGNGHSSSSFVEILNGLTMCVLCVSYITPDCSQLWFKHVFASEIVILFGDFHGGQSQDSTRAQTIFTELQSGSNYAPLSSSVQFTIHIGMRYTPLFRDVVSTSSCITPLFDVLAPSHLGNLLFPEI